MKTFITFAAFISIFLAASLPSQAGEYILTAVDVSGSTAMVSNDTVAGQAAGYLQSVISAMEPGSRVRILSIGAAGLGVRAFDLKAGISTKPRERSNVVAMQAAQFVAAIPSEVKAGRLEAQSSTSIIDFLEGLDAHDCRAQPTRVIIYSDGIESSPRVDSGLLITGKVKLPMPTTPFLEGCQIEMRGVGQLGDGTSSEGLYSLLKPQWAAYFTAAGAARVLITREVGGL